MGCRMKGYLKSIMHAYQLHKGTNEDLLGNTHIKFVLILYVMRYLKHLYIGDLKTISLWPVSAMSVPYWLTVVFWKALDDKNKQPVRSEISRN